MNSETSCAAVAQCNRVSWTCVSTISSFGKLLVVLGKVWKLECLECFLNLLHDLTDLTPVSCLCMKVNDSKSPLSSSCLMVSSYWSKPQFKSAVMKCIFYDVAQGYYWSRSKIDIKKPLNIYVAWHLNAPTLVDAALVAEHLSLLPVEGGRGLGDVTLHRALSCMQPCCVRTAHVNNKSILFRWNVARLQFMETRKHNIYIESICWVGSEDSGQITCWCSAEVGVLRPTGPSICSSFVSKCQQ